MLAWKASSFFEVFISQRITLHSYINATFCLRLQVSLMRLICYVHPTIGQIRNERFEDRLHFRWWFTCVHVTVLRSSGQLSYSLAAPWPLGHLSWWAQNNGWCRSRIGPVQEPSKFLQFKCPFSVIIFRDYHTENSAVGLEFCFFLTPFNWSEV